MSKSFEKYSNYYDLFYTSKNYKEECDYVEKLVKKYSSVKSKKLLDLGCGTGGHAVIHSNNGWKVTGIDRSKQMIDSAKKKSKGKNIDYYVGDITNYKLSGKFDVITAMFAVVSYLNTNDQLVKFFNNVKKHLKDNGIMIFDAWYGPAVLFQKPGDRYREINVDDKKIIRLVQSKLLTLENLVDVNIKILEIGRTKKLVEFEELHTMRYYFIKEIELLLEQNGLKLAAVHPFLFDSGSPTENDWNVTFIITSE